jgi:hypothetical protein
LKSTQIKYTYGTFLKSKRKDKEEGDVDQVEVMHISFHKKSKEQNDNHQRKDSGTLFDTPMYLNECA